MMLRHDCVLISSFKYLNALEEFSCCIAQYSGCKNSIVFCKVATIKFKIPAVNPKYKLGFVQSTAKKLHTLDISVIKNIGNVKK